ncbi:MAG: F0F1 ATP synthase subunit B [Clostridia bacterium]|nr:F0F1 ATP synthase subunit B [Clostridia bacterium]
MQSLDIISINLWNILISLANLLILFLLMKKFLYKPVTEVLEKRRAEINGDYAAADEAKRSALASKAEYEEKLSHAEKEASEMRKSAADEAKRHGERIIAEANARADGIVRAAESQILLDKKKAESDIKREIAEVSTLLAEKLIGKEVNADTHRELIDSFIEEIGDAK